MAEVKHDSGSVAGNTTGLTPTGTTQHVTIADESLSISDVSVADEDPTVKTQRNKEHKRGPHERVRSAPPKPSTSTKTVIAPSKRRGGHRPPSPSPRGERANTMIPNHQMIVPNQEGPDAQLAALVQQQHHDHEVFLALIAGMRDLQATIGRHCGGTDRACVDREAAAHPHRQERAAGVKNSRPRATEAYHGMGQRDRRGC